MAIVSINPATGKELKRFEPLTKEETMERVDGAGEAFGEWRESSFAERQKLLKAAADGLREGRERFAKLITLEMGKRIEEARGEIDYCARICEFYADRAEEFLADEAMDVDGLEAYLHYEPVGVLMGVMPWNFPFYQVIRFVAPNVMAGNVCMVKHASCVPQCSEAIESLFREAGAREGIFTNLLIPSEFVEAIIERDEVQGVSLTGSEGAGAAVAALAGKHLKRSVLELGGNDAFIVLEDVDVDEVVELAIKGRMVNTGQSCVASKRFIVVREVADAFIAGMKKGMSGMKMGDPMNEDVEVGPLSTEGAAVRLLGQVTKTVNAGAKVLLGGDRPEREGAFFNPTILTGVEKGMPSYDEELFGPVATIYVVDDEVAAIKLANDSSYGLGGSVFTKDLERGKRVAERVETGMMFLNKPTQSQSELPFGGLKRSGYGRELSHLGILEFVNKKLIYVRETE